MFDWFMKNIGFEGATAILLILYFVFFQIPKFILLFWPERKVKSNPFNDNDPSGNDNIKPRGPQDYL